MKQPLEITRAQYGDRTLYIWPDEGYWLVAEQDFWPCFTDAVKQARPPNALPVEYLPLYRELSKRGIIDPSDDSMDEAPGVIYFCPTKFVVSTTDVCNLKCPYCYASSSSTNSTYITHRDFQTALAFVSKFHDTETRPDAYKVSFVGGEPLLHQDLASFLELSRERGLLPSVTTNASVRPSPRLMSAIVRTGSEVNVSLDGHCPEVHNLTRRSSFESVMAFSQSLMKLGVPVCATCVVHGGNLPHLQELVALCLGKGFSALNFNTLNRMGRGTHPTGFAPVSRLDLVKELCRICASRPDHLAFLSHSAFFSKFFGLSRGLSQHDCGLRNNTFFLDADGQMYLCGALKLDELQVPYREAFDIHTARERISRAVSRYYVENLPECGRCDFRYFCAGDCRGESLAVFGDDLAPHPACDDIKETIILSMFELATGRYDI